MPEIIIVSSETISIEVNIKDEVITNIRLKNYPQKESFREKDRDLYFQFKNYLEGKPIDFNIKLDSSRLTAFQQEVFRELRNIPWGKTISYGELARRIKNKNYSRAVAGALRRNPYPIVIPCHRVVGFREVGGYSAGDGKNTKLQLLKLEGNKNFSK